RHRGVRPGARSVADAVSSAPWSDRKSTRLNSSHVRISYAVFCLKKKKSMAVVSVVPQRIREALNIRVVGRAVERGVFGVECFFFNDSATAEIYTLSLHDAVRI